MFWGRFYEACNLRGLKPNNVTKALGLSSATATKWKNGSDPKADALIKIADYLDVSVDYLLGRSDDPNKKTSAPPVGADELEVLADRLTRLDEASREAILQYAEFLLTRQDAAKDPGERQEAKQDKS